MSFLTAFDRFHLRASEWLILGYFAYVAVIAPWFIAAGKAWAMAAIVAVLLWLLSRFPSFLNGYLRDFAPLAFMLAAYREMDWFTPALRDHHLEQTWILWDRWLLGQAHLREAIESTGFLLPSYLELCYVLVYAVGPISLILLLRNDGRAHVDKFWLAHLAGTLGAYALFPYFPSEPPRTVFPGADLPQLMTAVRRLNLFIVGGYGIHSSVFPSAHVSSALSAAWALLAILRKRRWIGALMVAYGLSVALATIYGRYHYAVDALAGIAMSFTGMAAMRLSTFTKPSVNQ